jgi:hypothetical protein
MTHAERNEQLLNDNLRDLDWLEKTQDPMYLRKIRNRTILLKLRIQNGEVGDTEDSAPLNELCEARR